VQACHTGKQPIGIHITMEPTREQKIWQVVLAIPEGKVASYGQIADMAGLGRQARFVGKALGKLPAGHSVPWFRVIRTTGQIAFPPGSDTFERQKSLLESEEIEVINGRVPMARFRWQP
jgi:methylated-DNA-protein-cysteine methyltransferase-like protein